MNEERAPDDPRHDAARVVLQNMYGAYIEGDSAAIDSVLSAGFTIFDSAHADLIVGLDELNVVRSRRRVAFDENVIETAVTVLHPRLFDKGDAILIAYWLRVDFVDAERRALQSEFSRNTAWMRLEGGSWKISHLHEDVWSGSLR